MLAVLSIALAAIAEPPRVVGFQELQAGASAVTKFAPKDQFDAPLKGPQIDGLKFDIMAASRSTPSHMGD